jgi:hypothetical protein
MKTKSRIDLEPFFGAIKDIEEKNAGGCLMFCYVFYLWLKKNGYPLDSFTITQIGWKNTIEHNMAFLKGERDTAMSSSHFVWDYEGARYDGECLYLGGYSYCDKAPLPLFEDSIENFCLSALNNASWNRDFDRNRAIDIVQERLGLDLSLIKRF